MPSINKGLVIGALLIVAGYSNADQNITIIGGNASDLPKVVVVNFINDYNLANRKTVAPTTSKDDASNKQQQAVSRDKDTQALSEIIKNDLTVTGDLNVSNATDEKSVNTSKIQYVITGSVDRSSNKLNFILTQVGAKAPLLDQSILYSATNPRLAAHTASNNIYEKITSTLGIFTSKIAYVARNSIYKHGHNSHKGYRSNEYELTISDYDGYNPKVILRSVAPITSLNWNSNGTQIAYVSFESGKAVVYVQDVNAPKRYAVANYLGNNSSPFFIPSSNNTQLVVTLTKDGGSFPYIINNAIFNSVTSKATPIASAYNFGSIDTEISVSSNENIVFTSNHNGGPQIFLSRLTGGTPNSLTTAYGDYNTSAKFSHDGTKITFINRNGTYKTYVMDLSTKSAYPASINTSLDLDPSFSPNDKLILFSSDTNQMYLVNTTGTTQTSLRHIKADEIIDQSWSNNYQ